MVRSIRLEERLLHTRRKALLGPASNIEPHGRVNAVDALVIPIVASETQPVVGCPEAYRRMQVHKGVQGINDRLVGFGERLVPIGTPRELDGLQP